MSKKILVGLMTLVLAIGLVGAGAFAWFSDTETSEGNTFTAGTLDLKVDGQDDPNVVHLTIGPVKPGYSFVAGHGYIWELKNVGSIPGELDIKISAITNAENYDPATNEAELFHPVTNPTGDYDTLADGELGDNLWIKFSLQYWLPPPTNKYGYAKWYINEYGGYKWDGGTTNAIILACGATGTELLDPGQSVWFRIQTGGVLPGVGNCIQGDSVSFDVTFTLEQPEKD